VWPFEHHVKMGARVISDFADSILSILQTLKKLSGRRDDTGALMTSRSMLLE